MSNIPQFDENVNTLSRWALPLDKIHPRGIIKIQKGAVDLTVGPKRRSFQLTARVPAGRSTSFY